MAKRAVEGSGAQPGISRRNKTWIVAPRQAPPRARRVRHGADGGGRARGFHQADSGAHRAAWAAAAGWAIKWATKERRVGERGHQATCANKIGNNKRRGQNMRLRKKKKKRRRIAPTSLRQHSSAAFAGVESAICSSDIFPPRVTNANLEAMVWRPATGVVGVVPGSLWRRRYKMLRAGRRRASSLRNGIKNMKSAFVISLSWR